VTVPISQLIADNVRDIPDFPHAGVVFKDITPLLASPAAFAATIGHLSDWIKASGAELVVGIEARGFVLAAPGAIDAGLGFVPLRKPGKLPGATLSQAYALEYGEAALEMQQDAIPPGTGVVVVDDVLATGGTAVAAVKLIERAGAKVLGISCLIEISALGGRAQLVGYRLDTMLTV